MFEVICDFAKRTEIIANGTVENIGINKMKYIFIFLNKIISGSDNKQKLII